MITVWASDDCIFFFFNDTATTEIYTLSLHDALPIWLADLRGLGLRPARRRGPPRGVPQRGARSRVPVPRGRLDGAVPVLDPVDRKSTRLNSSHANISYAVFCLKKKKTL